MSLIIAIKEKDRIVVGCDIRVTGDVDFIDSYEISQKAIKLDNGIILGVTGNPLLVPFFKEELLKLNDIDRDILQYKIVLPLLRKLSSTNAMDNEGNFEGSLLIAKDDKAFVVESNGVIEEIYRYRAIGSGQYVAIGYLESVIASSNKTETMIANAIDAASKVIYSVSSIAYIGDTKNKAFRKVKT